MYINFSIQLREQIDSQQGMNAKRSVLKKSVLLAKSNYKACPYKHTAIKHNLDYDHMYIQYTWQLWTQYQSVLVSEIRYTDEFFHERSNEQ